MRRGKGIMVLCLCASRNVTAVSVGLSVAEGTELRDLGNKRKRLVDGISTKMFNLG